MSGALLAATVAAAGLAALLSALARPALRPVVAGLGTALVGVLGVATGVAVLSGGLARVRLGWLLPLAGLTLAGDGLGGLFLLVTAAVAVAAGLFTIGYARAHPLPAATLATLPLFVAAMLLVPLAVTVPGFLLLWELMALASLVLVLTEHRRQQARAAGLLYAVMTHLGFLAILIGLVVLAAATGSVDFPAIAAAVHGLPAGTRNAVLLLTLAGFGSKAGLLPLHAWLPRAHPEAPSPVSALMSAAMVNLGIYGIVRVDLVMLGPGPRWWGLVLLLIGAGSAVYGVLQASVAVDLKRLLAYSTSENMGLVAVGVGAGMLLAAAGDATLARVALTAALLHVVNHAAFKSLGFLAAGSVLSATGHRDLDLLGGLARRMPVTTAAFGISALGASGLPLGAGFISEWLLLQSLVHAPATGGAMLALAMPLAVAAVALTTGLGVAAMVKALGVGFLARPRSPGAAAAREGSVSMRAALGLLAAACVTLGLAPGLLAAPLRVAVATWPVVAAAPGPMLGALLRLPGLSGSSSPLLLAALVGAGSLLAAVAARRGGPARPAPLWACGGEPPSARMQYTATAFAEPLQRVFDDVLRPDTDITVTHAAESRYLLAKVSYRNRINDAVETGLHAPVLRVVEALARLARRAHSGSVHTYLGYGALGLLILLVVAR